MNTEAWARAEVVVVDPGNGGVVMGKLRFEFQRGDEGKDGVFDADGREKEDKSKISAYKAL